MEHLTHNCQYCGAALELSKLVNNIIRCESCNRENLIQAKSKGARYDFNLNMALDYRKYLQFNHAVRKYEEMLEDDPDDTDVLWGYILAKYGITYVDEDPTIFKYEKGKIRNDRYYKRLVNALGNKNHPYLIEIDKIDEIREVIGKKVIEDKGYDVFISYKRAIEASDGTEAFTRESEHARGVYNLLKDNGIDNIFFAQETLKNQPGSEFEAEIYMALKSAKVMILFASRDEWVTSKWIKNEWTRFLNYVKTDPSKKLFVVRTDGFTIEELPSDLRKLQDFDLQAVNFREDLLSHVNKYTKDSLSNIKRVEVKEIATRSTVKRSPVEIVTKKVGGSFVKDYRVKPSVDIKLKNIYALYLNKGNYSTSISELNKLKIEDPNDIRIDEALFLALNKLSKLDELPNKLFVENKSLPNLATLLEGSTKDEANKYINVYFEYLLKNLAVGKERYFSFFKDYYNFILPYLSDKEREELTNKLYKEIEKQVIEADFVFDIANYLYEVSKFIADDEVEVYIYRFNKVAEELIKKRKYQNASECLLRVYEIDELHPRALQLQFFIDYRGNGKEGHFEMLSTDGLEEKFQTLASVGGIDATFWRTIHDGVFYNIRDKKDLNSFNVYRLLLQYTPGDVNIRIKIDLPYLLTMAFTNGYFDETKDFVDFYLDLFPDDPNAHFIKYAYSIKASTFSEVLFIEKGSLLENELFLNVINSSEDNQDYIRFYEIHEEFKELLKGKAEDAKILEAQRPMFKKSYVILRFPKYFNEEEYPKFKRNLKHWNNVEYKKLDKELSDKVTGRSFLMLILYYIPVMPLLTRITDKMYMLPKIGFFRSLWLFIVFLFASPLFFTFMIIGMFLKGLFGKEDSETTGGAGLLMLISFIAFRLTLRYNEDDYNGGSGAMFFGAREFFSKIPFLPTLIGAFVISLLFPIFFKYEAEYENIYGKEINKMINSSRRSLAFMNIIFAIVVSVLTYFLG